MKFFRFLFTTILVILMLTAECIYAQDKATSCKVLYQNLSREYKGDCRNGFADGEGEAKGLHRYTGTFKNGLPEGKGVYYFSDTMYYSGNFLGGVKEGKGEMHFMHSGKTDSVVKGYWSGDEYRGKKYVTYNLTGSIPFARVDITASSESGTSLTFELTTTSGSPNGTFTGSGDGSGYVLSLTELYTMPGDVILPFVSKFETAKTSTYTFRLREFPVSLKARFSTGDTYILDLYKAANWKVHVSLNK